MSSYLLIGLKAVTPQFTFALQNSYGKKSHESLTQFPISTTLLQVVIVFLGQTMGVDSSIVSRPPLLSYLSLLWWFE